MILSSIPLKPEDKRESRIFENNCPKEPIIGNFRTTLID
jgi:hypothetical protein